MVGNLLVGNFQFPGFFQLRLLQQEGSQPLVNALPHDLLHEPHQLGEITAEQIAGIVRNRQRFIHQIFEHAGRNTPEFGVLFRLNHHIKLHIRHDTGRTQQTDIVLGQAADGDLSAILRQDVGAQLTTAHHHKAQAVGAAVVNMGILFDLPELNDTGDSLLLLCRQFIPKRKIFCKFHGDSTFRIKWNILFHLLYTLFCILQPVFRGQF